MNLKAQMLLGNQFTKRFLQAEMECGVRLLGSLMCRVAKLPLFPTKEGGEGQGRGASHKNPLSSDPLPTRSSGERRLNRRNILRFALTSALGVVVGLGTLPSHAQQEIDLTRTGIGIKPIPVMMSGFSGEVDSVLRFDLFVAGFEFVSDGAQFKITGKNNGNVEGHLTDLIAQKEILGKAYSGGTLRVQAHTLANDIVAAIRPGEKGIALSKIAFKGGVRASWESEMYIADYDGFGAKAVTADKSEVAMPSWVPGQRKLAYCSWKNGATQIFTHDLSSGARQILVRAPGNCYSPAVSPDGRKVAFVSNRTGNLELYVCGIDGSDLKQLTKKREEVSSPCWSPDGAKICFVIKSSGSKAALYTISPSGGEPQRLRVGNVLNLTEPDWSPDGKSIAFTALMGGFNICTIPSGGGEAEILTVGQDPCWAANSRTIIFTRQQNNKRVLSLLDAPTKRVKDAAQISGSSSQPSWAR